MKPLSEIQVCGLALLLGLSGWTAWAQTNPPPTNLPQQALFMWPQTNHLATNAPATNRPAAKAPATNAPQQELFITSESAYYDGITNQMVYIGHVYVDDHAKARLHCGRLTVSLPPNGGNPTNILAETNVVVDVLDQSGATNHITADKAVYAYGVVTNSPGILTTNETVTFTGGQPMPELTNAKSTVLADPMIMDVPRKTFSFPGKVEMRFRQPAGSGSATNGSPFQMLR